MNKHFDLIDLSFALRLASVFAFASPMFACIFVAFGTFGFSLIFKALCFGWLAGILFSGLAATCDHFSDK